MVAGNKIIVQVASIPVRVASLRLVVQSLLPQVDELFVSLNGYEAAPDFLLNNDKIGYVLLDNSLGASAKFYDIDKRNGYVLTCDDDFCYPSGYVQHMLDGLKKHGGIVTLHGKRFASRPISSYRNGYTQIFRCIDSVEDDYVVDIGGTGVMAFHTDSIKLSIANFPMKNMADIWLSKCAHEQGVPITVLSHLHNYVRQRRYSRRIWATEKHNNRYHTLVLNSFLKP
jgi:hypothetical protein